MSRYLKNGFNDVVDIVLGTEDMDGVEERLERLEEDVFDTKDTNSLLNRIYNLETNVYDGNELIALLNRMFQLEDKVKLLETKLKRLEN